MSKQVTLVAAIARDHAIGKNNELLWHLPEDLRHFKALTLGKTIIMGRKTFDSIGKPLPKRENWVISRQEDWQHEGTKHFRNLDEALSACQDGECMIVGGAEIYAIALPLASHMELTHVHAEYPDADSHFPKIDLAEWDITSEREGIDEEQELRYTFRSYIRRRP